MASMTTLCSIAAVLLINLLQTPGTISAPIEVMYLRTALQAGEQSFKDGYPTEQFGMRVFQGTVYDNATNAALGFVNGFDIVTKKISATSSISNEKSVYTFTSGGSIEIGGLQSAGSTAMTILQRPLLGGTGKYVGVTGFQIREVIAPQDFVFPTSIREIVSTIYYKLDDPRWANLAA